MTPSRQDHILQQLTAIKEVCINIFLASAVELFSFVFIQFQNLVRRQQEVATSMNAIPV